MRTLQDVCARPRPVYSPVLMTEFQVNRAAPALALLSLLTTAPAEPTLFGPGTISTGDMELNAAFTPDGRTLYFTKRSPKAQFWTIVVSRLRNGAWSAAEVADFSGQYNDFDPFVSPD